MSTMQPCDPDTYASPDILEVAAIAARVCAVAVGHLQQQRRHTRHRRLVPWRFRRGAAPHPIGCGAPAVARDATGLIHPLKEPLQAARQVVFTQNTLGKRRPDQPTLGLITNAVAA